MPCRVWKAQCEAFQAASSSRAGGSGRAHQQVGQSEGVVAEGLWHLSAGHGLPDGQILQRVKAKRRWRRGEATGVRRRVEWAAETGRERKDNASRTQTQTQHMHWSASALAQTPAEQSQAKGWGGTLCRDRDVPPALLTVRGQINHLNWDMSREPYHAAMTVWGGWKGQWAGERIGWGPGGRWVHVWSGGGLRAASELMHAVCVPSMGRTRHSQTLEPGTEQQG